MPGTASRLSEALLIVGVEYGTLHCVYGQHTFDWEELSKPFFQALHPVSVHRLICSAFDNCQAF